MTDGRRKRWGWSITAIAGRKAETTGRRNTVDHILFEQPVESLSRCLPIQRFPGARVQGMGYGAQLFSAVLA
ncbi:hypothetical protein GCM10010961_35960 [Pseudodonghicola xiamenensis]|uniref:Uncharacterized protein n=1 Tax=Pseudodonghicola xiamenensis TaxID=337702 RepID=A0A8J3HBX2_9RHOB|nr:hypothetical protein GCM10010961_35960 [Pseudodonghicola xiamenensis]